ncbi:MAG: cation:proton antiporter [Anaerolineae bacterium]
MAPALQLLLALFIILVAAKSAGYLSTRLGQPSVLGELLIGLILGPTLFNMLHWPFFNDPHLGETVSHLAELGVLILMFVAGMEVDIETMLRAGRPAVLAGVVGVIAPILLGGLQGWLAGFDLAHSTFLGLTLAATSVSISAQTLMELNVLRSRVGMALLGAAVVDDVLVVLLLSVFMGVAAGSSSLLSIVWVLARMVIFLVLSVWLGGTILPRLGALVERLPISEGMMALALAMTFLYAWAAEALGGMAAITGAFIAGLIFGRSPFRQEVEKGMHTIAYAWLVPIFFVSIGLETNARSLGISGIPFALILVLIAMLSKVIGCGLGARLGGFANGEALRLGVGMSSRGEVGLIVATVGMSTGLVDDMIFAGVVLMVLATTLLTPILLRALYPRPAAQPQPQAVAETDE